MHEKLPSETNCFEQLLLPLVLLETLPEPRLPPLPEGPCFDELGYGFLVEF